MTFINPKLRKKMEEALVAVMPIVGIVLVLCFSVAPISPSILLSFFPDYNGAFLVREDTFEKFEAAAPELEEVLNLLAGQISNEDMVEMTYQVDVMSRGVDEVALEFLKERGIIFN